MQLGARDLCGRQRGACNRSRLDERDGVCVPGLATPSRVAASRPAEVISAVSQEDDSSEDHNDYQAGSSSPVEVVNIGSKDLKG